MARRPEEEYDDEYEEEDGEYEEEEADEGEEEEDGEDDEVAEEEEGVAGEEQEEEEEEEEDEEEEDWTGFASLPAEARQLWLDAIHTLRDGGRRSLTVLLLGKSGAGKSSAINALLGQQAVKVGVNKLTAQGELVRRVVVRLPQGAPGADDDDAGFRVRLLDTAGLVDQSAGDAVDRQALLDVAASLAKTDVDLVLYVDRLDLYCVDALDKALVRAIGDTFGGRLWHKAALLLTRSDMKYTPSGMSYEEYRELRAEALRGAIRRTRPFFSPALPEVFAEAGGAAATAAAAATMAARPATAAAAAAPSFTLARDPEYNWLAALLDVATAQALDSEPYRYKASYTKAPGGGLLTKLLVLGAAALQVYLYKTQLRPYLDREERAREERRRRVWEWRQEERKEMNLLPSHHRPDDPDAWRTQNLVRRI